MKIRTKLRLVAGCSITAVLVLGLVLSLLSSRMERGSTASAVADEIVIDLFELRNVAFEYIYFQNSRAREQWQIKYRHTAPHFQREIFASLEDQAVAAGMEKDFKAIGELFDLVVELRGKKGLAGEKERALLHEQETILINSFLISSMTMVRDSHELARAIRNTDHRQHEIFHLLLIISLSTMTAGILAISVLLGKSISKPITKLHRGTEIIGAGNLDYRIDIQSKDEIGQLARAFDRMTENLKLTIEQLKMHSENLEKLVLERTRELERSNKELEQFAYIASHDLQEPVRTVSSFVRLLARRYRGKLDQDADDFISYAVSGSERMQRMITDLLTYSRVGTKGQPFAAVDCGKVLDEVLANLQVQIEENRAEINLPRGPLPVVMADATQLAQLLQNLISNAIKYQGSEPPKIELFAKRIAELSISDFGFLISELTGEEDNYKADIVTLKSDLKNGWIFAIRDNGIGFEQQYAEKIFDIFRRLHPIGKYSGSGIGLAVCRKIVERHGGRIWAESAPGRGTTFFFTLPDRQAENG